MAAPANYIKSCEYLQLEEVLTDSSSVYSTDTAIDLSERLDSISVDPTILEFKVEADSKIQDIFNSMSEAKVTVVLTGMTEAELATILGRTTVGLMYGFGDCSSIPSFMLKFQVLMTDGSYRWFELWKCKFKEIKREFKTQKSSNLEIQYVTLEALATARVYQHASDTGVNNLGFSTSDTTIGATWFTEGDNLSTPDLVAPTFTIVPLDEAIDVAITADVVLTFDKGVIESYATDSANFILFKDEDDSVVAGAYAISEDAEVNDTVTFNPTASLTNNKKYKVVVTKNVKSLNGVAMAANAISYFTTIAA